MVRKTTKKEIVEKKSAKAQLSISVYDLSGKVEKDIEIPKEIFSVDASPKLLAQYVRVYLANQRQGTVSAKTRSEVTGSTKKIYRQKGTGRARHGAKKAPIFVGGGVTWANKPTDYSLKMNKKQRKKALFSSLTMQLKKNAVIGLSDSAMKTEPKTKQIAVALKMMGIADKKILLVLPDLKNNLHLASRNLSNVDLVSSTSVNPYAVCTHESIVFTEGAMNSFVSHFLKNNEN